MPSEGNKNRRHSLLMGVLVIVLVVSLASIYGYVTLNSQEIDLEKTKEITRQTEVTQEETTKQTKAIQKEKSERGHWFWGSKTSKDK